MDSSRASSRRLAETLRRVRRTITARLTAYYAIIFAICLFVGLAAIDRGLWIVLVKSDRGFLHSQMKELTREYRDGMEGLRKGIGNKHSSVAAVRISDPANQTIAFLGPDWNLHRAIEQLPLAGPSPWSATALKNGEMLDVVRGPLSDGNIIQVARSDHSRRQVMRHFERVSAGTVLPMLAMGAAGGALLASRTLRPVRELNEAVREIIATGRTDARLQSSSTAGELRDLVGAFNEMLARIDALIETLKGTLDNVAHDLRTPLSRLRGIAELALQKSDNATALREALADCVEEAERVGTLLNTIMDITEVESGAMKLQLKPVNLSVLGCEIVELYQQVAEEKGVTLRCREAGELMVLADENRLRQALANLVDNAIKYTSSGGSVQVAPGRRRGRPALSVEDTGLGIPAEEQSRVWERLYRSDQSRAERGLGLGLSLVRAIMQAHHGVAEMVSVPGVGSAFTLCFPAFAEENRGSRAPQSR